MSKSEVFQENNPRIEIIDGRLYVAGVYVQPWQLTADELKKYFPEQYKRQYEDGFGACPVCGDKIRIVDKRGLLSHTRLKHKDWYNEQKKVIQAAKTVSEYLETFAPGDQGGSECTLKGADRDV